MKILIHSNYSPNGSFGGIENVVAQIIKIAYNVTNDISCLYGDQTSGKQDINGVKYISRKITRKINGAPVLSLGNLFLIYHGLQSDLIIFQEPFPILWPAIYILRNIFRKNIIVLVHADPAARRWVKRIYKNLRGQVFRGSICITTSPNLKDIIFSNKYKYIDVIPLALPDDSLSKRHSYYRDYGEYVLYVGRLADYKGLPILLEAAMLTPSIQYVIAGDGPLKLHIQDKILNQSIRNIIFINRFISEQEKFDLISDSKFVIFPSTSENEAFGLVQLEAMRAGKALINTFLNSGVNFVAPHMICALTVKSNDSLKLTEAIAELWINDALREKLEANAKSRYTTYFTTKHFSKRWFELIKSSLLLK